jgi:hypothetical protein
MKMCSPQYVVPVEPIPDNDFENACFSRQFTAIIGSAVDLTRLEFVYSYSVPVFRFLVSSMKICTI